MSRDLQYPLYQKLRMIVLQKIKENVSRSPVGTPQQIRTARRIIIMSMWGFLITVPQKTCYCGTPRFRMSFLRHHVMIQSPSLILLNFYCPDRRDKLPCTRYTVSKVKSHIDKEEAEDESHWEINNIADRLATEARGKVLSDKLRLTEPMFFEGVKAGCMRWGQLITGTLKTEIQQVLYEEKMKQYLGLKYGWNESIFNNIDWE